MSFIQKVVFFWGWLCVVCGVVAQSAARVDTAFRDSALPMGERVECLLRQLTMEEKLSMMQHQTPAIPRLGLEAYSWWSEALHGVARNGTAHVYPMPIAMAATFDTALVRVVFENIAVEAQRKFYEARKAGQCGDNTGLSFYAPNMNIFRDPRWGRGMETFGEDPYLTALMGAAVVRGLQGEDAARLRTVACVKHLAAHSGPEGSRHAFDAEVTARDMWCTYLPAFGYVIAQGEVQQVMCAYNRLNHIPCSTHPGLFDLLRRRWHYDGLVVTDCWAINDCWERDSLIPRHETHATAALAAADAFGQEVDMECGSGLAALRTAVDSGYVGVEKVDEHVRRILALRLRLGLEERLRSVPPVPVVVPEGSPYVASLRSLVLLKNGRVAQRYPALRSAEGEGPILPLTRFRRTTRLAVVGPNGDDSLMALGNYNGVPERCITVLEGLQERSRRHGGSYEVVFSHPACGLVGDMPRGRRFWRGLERCDVVVFVGGLSPALEGEELQVEQEGFYRGDRTAIELPEAQCRAIKEIRRRTGKPIVLVLCTGGALALSDVVDDVDAIVVAWYGGEAMGQAVAEALWEGDMRGHLPVTFYRSTRQLPPYEDYGMAGRTYRYMAEEPLFPFGFGLSTLPVVVDSVWYHADSRTVRGTVRGAPGATTLVQVYLQGYCPGEDPEKTLVGMQHVHLPEGAEGAATVSFAIPLPPQWMVRYDPFGATTRPLRYGTPLVLKVGTSSAERDLTALPIVWQ